MWRDQELVGKIARPLDVIACAVVVGAGRLYRLSGTLRQLLLDWWAEAYSPSLSLLPA